MTYMAKLFFNCLECVGRAMLFAVHAAQVDGWACAKLAKASQSGFSARSSHLVSYRMQRITVASGKSSSNLKPGVKIASCAELCFTPANVLQNVRWTRARCAMAQACVKKINYSKQEIESGLYSRRCYPAAGKRRAV